jgi:flagellum-specific peptidoglycan hydrolase FlgJ
VAVANTVNSAKGHHENDNANDSEAHAEFPQGKAEEAIQTENDAVYSKNDRDDIEHEDTVETSTGSTPMTKATREWLAKGGDKKRTDEQSFIETAIASASKAGSKTGYGSIIHNPDGVSFLEASVADKSISNQDKGRHTSYLYL